MIKQAIIGSLTLFGMAAMGATVIILLYKIF
jgi:hypothetical protein